MRAWQFVDTGEPLLNAEVEEPRAVPGEVVIDVRAAGLCHSDVGMMYEAGFKEYQSFQPITMGHEVAGVIAEVGTGVTDWKVGDRVALSPMGKSGPSSQRNGGFQPKVTAVTEDLIAVPETVSWAQAAAATDAGMTSHYAVSVQSGGITPGMTVGIIGFGGLGALGAQVALALGAEVYVSEIGEKAAENARKLPFAGVTKSLKEVSDNGILFDVIVDFAGFGTTTAEAVDIIKPEGTVVVGMGKLESTISTNSLIGKNVHLVGSLGGTSDDISRVIEMFSAGQLQLEINEITWSQIPQALDDLKNHRVTGRTVCIYDGPTHSEQENS